MPRGIPIHILSNINLEDNTATCAKCGPSIPIRIKSGKPRCRESIREAVRAARPYTYRDPRRHGLTVVEARELRETACCYICGSRENLKVDHDHNNKDLRGILCHEHNVALGFFKDNVEHLQLAIEYLNNPPGVIIGNN